MRTQNGKNIVLKREKIIYSKNLNKEFNRRLVRSVRGSVRYFDHSTQTKDSVCKTKPTLSNYNLKIKKREKNVNNFIITKLFCELFRRLN